LFTDSSCFVHHPPLPALPIFSDEGAANHSRFCSDYESVGVELFVYGKSGFSSFRETNIFPARQTREASEIIALRHKLTPKKTVVARQNPAAIDSGVFHNDVICTADKNLIFYHELAFSNTEEVLKEIEEKLYPLPLLKIPVRAKDITLNECVSSYLFNSQLLPLGKDEWMLLAPMECNSIKTVGNYLNSLTQNSPIKEVCFISILQSMKNGGGPACLRIRIVLTEEEAKAVHKGVFLDQNLYEQLTIWVKKHYRDRLDPTDLLDSAFIRDNQTALDELSQLLQLKNIYLFQSESYTNLV